MTVSVDLFRKAKSLATQVQTWNVGQTALKNAYISFLRGFHNHQTLANLSDVISYGKALKYSDAKIKRDITTVSKNPTPKTRRAVGAVGNPKTETFVLMSYTSKGGKYEAVSKSANYDKLLDLAQKKNESTLYDAQNRHYEVVSLADYQALTKTRKRNGPVSDFKQFQTERLTDLAQMFQGHSTGEVKRIIGPDSAPRSAYPLGHLVLMKVKHNGKTTDIEFDGQALLTGDIRNNLWVKGKDAPISNLPTPKPGELKELGKLIQIDYVTAKRHIEGGKTVRFWHPLGEIDKDYPTLYIDHDGFPIIVGGGYDVWKVGIVN